MPFQRDVSTENGDDMAMMVSAGSRHTLFLRLDGKSCGAEGTRNYRMRKTNRRIYRSSHELRD